MQDQDPNLIQDPVEDPNSEDNRTIFCANLSEQVTEEILFELFLQGGPLESVRIPKDKDGRQKTFGFITYAHSCSPIYALQIFEGLKLFGKNLVMKYKGNPQNFYQRLPEPAPRYRNDDNRKRKNVQTSYPSDNNCSLRLGSYNNNSIANTDSSLTPMKKNNSEENRRNPFDVDVLSRLSGNLLFPDKDECNNGKKNSGNQRWGRNDTGITKRSSRGNRYCRQETPYKRQEKRESKSRYNNQKRKR